MSRARDAEVHFFVVWEKARPWADQILEDLRRHFTILAGFEVAWSPEADHRQFSRLYGQSLPAGSDKVQECGTGPFLLLVVKDERPRYGRRKKWGTTTTVNTNLFDAKSRYREWAGGSRVHNSSDENETDRDLFVLLGRRRNDFAGADTPPWNGRLERLVRDPAGTGGWDSLGELLTAVELTLPYVLLPGPPGPARTLRMLVNVATDSWGVEWLVAAPDPVPLHARSHRYPFRLAGEDWTLELHHVGDGTMSPQWQRHLLDLRQRDDAGAFVLPAREEFFVLLHQLPAAPVELSAQQQDSLAQAARAADVPVPSGLDRTRAAGLLDDHLHVLAASASAPTLTPSSGLRTSLSSQLARLRR